MYPIEAHYFIVQDFGWSNAEAVEKILQGYRLPHPKNCPDEIYGRNVGKKI